MPSRIYVASSWRCQAQPFVVGTLLATGHEVYDFRHPKPGDDGFHWSAVMPSYRRGVVGDGAQLANAAEYVDALGHPIAEAGFANDFAAMQWADACVLVLPCNRSAHLELGWFVGQGKATAILLDGDSVTPELMYKLVDHVALDITGILDWLTSLDAAVAS